MKKGTAKIVAVIAAIGLVVIFMVMPRAPKSATEAVDLEPLTDVEQEIAEAVQMVQSGAQPMEGILKLRGVAERDSTNETAQLWLGVFSLQSGQTDKAIERFEIVKRLNPENPEPYWQLGMLLMDQGAFGAAIPDLTTAVGLDSTYVNGLFFVGQCYEELSVKDSALVYYRAYLPYAPDTIVSSRVEQFIKRLEEPNT
ncbi:MAG: tetratricopeptide (TPR) repeat protein [Flavobacteriales bacterium]|jgi:tetratricopeptide (TPR) repeat protein